MLGRMSASTRITRPLEWDSSRRHRSANGRTGEPHELGWAATDLYSPYAAYFSGHTLVLDGANWLRRGLVMPEFVAIRDPNLTPDRAQRE